jgi:uncharacterized protein YlxW (UPF0749 family)
MRKTHKAKDRAYDKLLKEYTDLQYYCQQLQTKVITLQDNAHASR